MFTKSLVTTIFLNLVFLLFSQEKSLTCYELDMHQQFSQCGSMSFGKDGVVLYCKEIKPNKSDFVWKISLIDTNLVKADEVDLAVPKFATLKRIAQDDNFIYCIFMIGSKKLLVYRIHHFTLKIDLIETEVERGVNSFEFTTEQEDLFLYLKSTSSTQLYKFDFHEMNVIKSEVKFARPGFNKLFLKELIVDSLSQELLVTVEVRNEIEQKLFIYVYDLQLNLLDIFDPNFFTENSIYSIHATSVAPNEYLYTGTYSLAQDGPIEGVFCIGIVDRQKLSLNSFIKLNELDAFKRYLKEDGLETKDLQKAKRNLITAVHGVYLSNERSILLVEFYGPTYTVGVGATILFGSIGALASYKFDGFLYKGADVIALDDNGTIDWDLFLNMHPKIKPFKENLLVNVTSVNETIALNYPVGKDIKKIEFDHEGNILSQKLVSGLISEKDGKLELWYSDVFINSGNFDKYIVFNAESVADKVIVKHNAYFIEKHVISDK